MLSVGRPEYLHIADLSWSRYAHSAILTPDPDPAISNLVQTSATATYGDALAPLGFRLGNGGAGHTGILKLLCEVFIASRGGGFKLEWVLNHSRHTQIALLGDVVQVALTYEPEYEELAVREGWAAKVSRVFNDHFILAGPREDPAALGPEPSITSAMAKIAFRGSSTQPELPAIFHTRADGSATYYKELELWQSAQVNLDTASSWRVRIPVTPYEALLEAESKGAYLITDRATYLTAKRDGVLKSTTVFVEGGPQLLNPCSALINVKAPYNRLARDFASWLCSAEVQLLVRGFGRKWNVGIPIFCVADQQDVAHEDRLLAKL
ncbi:hypothetical protein AUEXF2481DRAFT_43915 [Aureobasidium subglaciale EXF-2481]|uniref:PBP domain-containing protein n=1 Tax=Aureobasidium subglaciale (strain EXF-2481) TaxID=1043005 RepID=A0A074YBH9_AURSE|nr:uncharacterized protein AUEXF2481DRAFT_43915 [Aureobasidium subglaciale EXF-2481]KAI5200371.1 hypothetical protein E4T38_06512 [Aureobasidium subglaciale]KAI5218939.1 hypothetical protein E4T40_06631 [Aureobasidium subglaciale]KAI5222653.1 hypothetical protein E4T41_06452 [Aureobasidium subglaciale]KAI5260236.1 hypothetical protein E4T46_06164 [Aureobasidium subglaciale]KEQ91522.1 hypothetical protein AUEXF2481DRAFT_43915 [Aureobasidium subglaciale EXF-2481]